MWACKNRRAHSFYFMHCSAFTYREHLHPRFDQANQEWDLGVIVLLEADWVNRRFIKNTYRAQGLLENTMDCVFQSDRWSGTQWWVTNWWSVEKLRWAHARLAALWKVGNHRFLRLVNVRVLVRIGEGTIQARSFGCLRLPTLTYCLPLAAFWQEAKKEASRQLRNLLDALWKSQKGRDAFVWGLLPRNCPTCWRLDKWIHQYQGFRRWENVNHRKLR